VDVGSLVRQGTRCRLARAADEAAFVLVAVAVLAVAVVVRVVRAVLDAAGAPTA
jgi:hypothetical protein